MKALVIRPGTWAPHHEFPELILTPQTEADLKVLEHLLENYQVSGFGRHPDSNQIIHLSIEIQPAAQLEQQVEDYGPMAPGDTFGR